MVIDNEEAFVHIKKQTRYHAVSFRTLDRLGEGTDRTLLQCGQIQKIGWKRKFYRENLYFFQKLKFHLHDSFIAL